MPVPPVIVPVFVKTLIVAPLVFFTPYPVAAIEPELVNVVIEPPLSLRTPSVALPIDPVLVTSKGVVALLMQGPVLAEVIIVALPQPLARESPDTPSPSANNSAPKQWARWHTESKRSDRMPREVFST